jgi:Rieske 2Fe-2S family protein
MDGLTPIAAERDVPLRVTENDRIPAARYHDSTFFDLEAEHLWPHVWQMACRLDEIPNPGDFVEYTNLGRSVVVVRGHDGHVNAFHNACRHRGVQLAEDRGNAHNGFVCPFHGWCYGLDGANTFVYSPDHFRDEQLDPDELGLRPCRVDTWGGSAFINHDDDAPDLRASLEPFATSMDAFNPENMRTEWWEAAILPVNWRLALSAFVEGYHVRTTHPGLIPNGTRDKETYAPSRPDVDYASRYAGTDDARTQVDNFLDYIKNLSEGMGGMVHAREVAVAESIRDIQLDDPATASRDFTEHLYAALTAWGNDTGVPMPDFDAITAQGIQSGVYYAFPHYFLLPVYASASQYRVRPLGPEQCLFEIWSLTPYAEGEAPQHPPTPTPMAPDDPRWPWVPAEDFSNLPRQQLGLHAEGFDYMRLAQGVEGAISNLERLVDGYLAGVDPQLLLQATNTVSGHIGSDIKDIGF